MPGEHTPIRPIGPMPPLASLVRRHADADAGPPDRNTVALGLLAEVQAALAEVHLPGFSFRAGLVGGRPYLQAGRFVLPSDAEEYPIAWGRVWTICGVFTAFEVARLAFRAALDKLDRDAHEAFEFEGRRIFRKH